MFRLCGSTVLNICLPVLDVHEHVRDNSRLSVQESRRQVQARMTLLQRIQVARTHADTVPIVAR